MKAVMYGAGNIGRGFIGQIFVQSGYELIFIDVADDLVSALNHQKRYPVRILGDDTVKDIWIEGVNAINGKDEEAASQAIADADIMATAVGVGVLPYIAPVVAAGLKKRFTQTCKPLNIIICENLIGADKIFARLIKDQLSAEEQILFDKRAGLVTASIGRMVPLQTFEMQDGNPLRVCVEAYGFLPVDKTAFRGEIPSLEGLCPFDNFDFYIQRKLFIHNMGHAICAYLGILRGYNFIYEACSHHGIFFIVQNAMLESARALSDKFGEQFADLRSHIQDLLVRFSNKALGDTCERVGADTTRKLGSNDRLIGAHRLCAEQGISADFISAGTSAALYYHLKEKGTQQSMDNAAAALREISSCGKDIEEKILSYYSMLVSFPQGGDFETITGKIIKTASMTLS